METNPPQPSDPDEFLRKFTLEQKKDFVLRHIQQLAQWQNPGRKSEYEEYVKNSELDWINKTFLQFSEMYGFNPEEILKVQ